MANIIFRSHKDEMDEALKSAIDIGMEAVAQQAEKNALVEVKKLVYDTPESPYYVRTGKLKGSISHKYIKETTQAFIGTNIEYAKYVEYGTYRMGPRPFLRNACQNYIDKYQNILNAAIKANMD